MLKPDDVPTTKMTPTLEYESVTPLPSQDPELRELLPVILGVAGVFVLALLLAIFAGH
ncbi:MAG TPA: hypothetical protein VGI81_19575 [Tepidisphaeraceae bacterium]